MQYALARLWMSWGVTPAAMIGHSLGELTAATVAGVFSLADASRIVAERGRLLQAAPPGAMRAVFASAERVRPLLPADVSIAAINGPRAIVVAGPSDSVESAASVLDGVGLRSRPLRTLRAFHTAATAGAAESFGALVAGCRRCSPAIAFLSTVTGDWISDDEATDPAYWAAQLRQPVRFADCAARLLASGVDAVLEIGPGRTISSLLADNAAEETAPALVASLPGGPSGLPDSAALLRAAAQLWATGTPLDWEALHAQRSVRRVRVPTYPFERMRYSLHPDSPHPGSPRPDSPRADSPRADSRHPAGPMESASLIGEPGQPQATSEPVPAHPRPDLETAYRAPDTGMQQRLIEVVESVLGIAGIGVDDSFFAVGGDSLMAVRVMSRIRGLYGVDLPTAEFFAEPTVGRLETLLTSALEKAVSVMDAAEVAAFLDDLERSTDHG